MSTCNITRTRLGAGVGNGELLLVIQKVGMRPHIVCFNAPDTFTRLAYVLAPLGSVFNITRRQGAAVQEEICVNAPGRCVFERSV